MSFDISIEKSNNSFAVSSFKNKFTKAKLYIATKEVNGVKKPDLTQRWYVWFRYKYPNKEGWHLFKYKKGINRLKTVKERKFYGNQLADSYNKMLLNGYNPFPVEKIQFESVLTVKKAVEYALSVKKLSLKKNSFEGYLFVSKLFNEWCVLRGIDTLPIGQFTFHQALGFINYLRKDKSKGSVGTTINNYRSELSSLFSLLKKERFVKENFFSDIETKRSKPKRHKSFTTEEVKKIKEYLIKNDKQLYYFITVVLYCFLRNREAVELKVGDIDLQRRLIVVETKTEVASYKIITDKIHSLFVDVYKIHEKDKNDHIFTLKTGVAGTWGTPTKSKLKHFSEKFKKARIELGFSSDYTIYSFRHTIISDIFVNLIKKNNNEKEAISKLMSITGHASEDSLRKYLRKIGAILPNSSENIATIDF